MGTRRDVGKRGEQGVREEDKDEEGRRGAGKGGGESNGEQR